MDIEKVLKAVIEEKGYNDSQIKKVHGGASSASTYYIKNTNEKNYYIKIQEVNNDCSYLLSEKIAYEWLKDYLLVAEVIFYELYDTYEVLCISEIMGSDFKKIRKSINSNEIIKLYARGLKKLHDLPLGNCHIVSDLDNKLEKALERVEKSLVNYKDFEDEYKGILPKDLYKLLINKRPLEEELVFTHGDYCFDNIILSSDKSIGYIDLGNSGLACKYQDIAIAVRSIKHDYGDEYLDIFFKEYGLSQIDQNKIEFYTILDEFS